MAAISPIPPCTSSITAPRPIAGDLPSNETQFTLPTAPSGQNWYRVTDTCEWNDGPNTWAAPGNETLIGPGNSTYGVCGQALVLFIAK